jgi:hypothetical protein
LLQPSHPLKSRGNYTPYSPLNVKRPYLLRLVYLTVCLLSINIIKKDEDTKGIENDKNCERNPLTVRHMTDAVILPSVGNNEGFKT